MHDENLAPRALHEYEVDARFGERLAALTTYREVRERRWRGEARRGDRVRLRDALDTLESTGGVLAEWHDTR